MGPPQGKCKPSSALLGKGHFILSSGDRGIRNKGQMGKGEEVLCPQVHLLDKKDSCLSLLICWGEGEEGKRV